MNISKRKIAKRFLLPEVLPRVNDLLGSPFQYLAVLLAHLYAMLRLLPQDHPYLTAGKQSLTVREVLREASSHLKFQWRYLDQIIIYFSVLVGIVLFVVQFILMFIAIFVSTASAASIPDTVEGFFNVNNVEEDLAFRILDLVFGHPDFFGSKDAGPEPIHSGLQAMLELYSYGIVIVGSMVLVYYIFVLVNETAQTGVPFGKRFMDTHAWMPVRIILFFGLLIPISNGFNAGQYLTLGAAKLGSGLATTGWTLYGDTVAATGETILGQRKHLVGRPNAREMHDQIAAMQLANICRLWRDENYNSDEYPPSWDPAGDETGVKPWVVYKDSETKKFVAELMTDITFQDATEKSTGDELYIYFGVKDEGIYKEWPASVQPSCGILSMTVSDISQPGSAVIQNSYYQMILDLWNGTGGLAADAQKIIKKYSLIEPDPDVESPERDSVDQLHQEVMTLINGPPPSLSGGAGAGGGGAGGDLCEPKDLSIIEESFLCLPCTTCEACADCDLCSGCTFCEEMCAGGESGAGGGGGEAIAVSAPSAPTSPTSPTSPTIPASSSDPGLSDAATSDASNIIDAAVQVQRNSGDWGMGEEFKKYGWVGAAIWYNKIAEQNGALTDAIYATPNTTKMPLILEEVAAHTKSANSNSNQTELSCPKLSNDSKVISFPEGTDENLVHAMCYFYLSYEKDMQSQRNLTGNIFLDSALVILGAHSLFDMCKTDNQEVHPLAQLSVIGKSMLESSIRSFTISVGATIFSIIPTNFTASGTAVAKLFSTVASLGLLVGFILFYVMPFMPFMYFFFAVASWVKTIFEAIVAIPLWALAHLRIDGQGIAGEAAEGGYVLLFEIFIRPILIIFGLIAAITVFASMVSILHEVFDDVIRNVGGDGKEVTNCKVAEGEDATLPSGGSIVDQFFFTVLYVIIVYMVGLASFKLVDDIPKSILRWFGASVDALTDDVNSAASGINKYIAMAGSQFGGKLSGAVEKMGEGAQATARQTADRLTSGR